MKRDINHHYRSAERGNTMARYRNIESAYKEIKANDPDTCITRYQLQQIIRSGKIPAKKNGKCYLFDMDKLEQYLSS